MTLTWLSDADLDYFWLGPIGALRQLPLLPVGGTSDADETLIGGVSTGLDGTATAQVLGHRRSWSLDWVTLHPDDTGPLRSWYLGLIDADLRIVDPRARNRLSRNGSAGGCYDRDATGFSVTAGTLAFAAVTDYPTTLSGLLDGALSWSVPVTTVATLRIDDTARIPLVPGETVTVAMLVKGTLGAQLGVRQYTAAGATTDSLASSVTLGSWAWLTHTLTPSASQVSGSLALTVASGAARTVTVGPAMWIKGSTVLGWVPGDGCPVVLMEDMGTTYPGLAAVNSGVVLREA